MNMRMVRMLLVASVGVALLGAACGGGGESTADKKAKITANWEAFFNPDTPTPKRLSLLENGDTAKLKAVAQAAEANPQAKATKAKVKTITITGDSAAVTYDLLSTQNNTPLLPNAQGKAVKVKGTWKVSQQSFCALIALGGGSC
jgi:hypothetical protein